MQAGSFPQTSHEQTAVGHDDRQDVIVFMCDAPREFTEDFELLSAGKLVAQRFGVAPQQSLVQRSPHGRCQSREAIFQNIVGGSISKGIHRRLLTNHSRHDKKWNIGSDPFRQLQDLQAITTRKREVGEHEIHTAMLKRS